MSRIATVDRMTSRAALPPGPRTPDGCTLGEDDRCNQARFHQPQVSVGLMFYPAARYRPEGAFLGPDRMVDWGMGLDVMLSPRRSQDSCKWFSPHVS
jgi:hypothetical protein